MGTTTTAAAVSGIELSSGLSMVATVDGDDINFEVKSSMNSWIGLGFVAGTSVSMLNADTFICSGGNVLRYWMTQKSEPTNGVAVPGSSCSTVSGQVTMQFTRKLEAPTEAVVFIHCLGGICVTVCGLVA